METVVVDFLHRAPLRIPTRSRAAPECQEIPRNEQAPDSGSAAFTMIPHEHAIIGARWNIAFQRLICTREPLQPMAVTKLNDERR